jgi:hypothetical protein
MNDQPRASGSSPPPQPSREASLYDHGREVFREVQALRTAAEETAAEASELLCDRMQQRPYITLATAAAVGYVVGGGLASRLTGAVLAVAGRFAIALVARELSRVVESTAAQP